ncbi:TPA: hypothetical protein SAN82_004966 [Pseudomonas putida]|nr:hypothetical protein [Pseudomonas putida]
MPMNNQPLSTEKADRSSEKLDGNHLKASVCSQEICVKNAAPPNIPAAKRSQGGV